jgi:ABC-type Fe3+/spermidine/putrescine transport system ATPase subunit
MVKHGALVVDDLHMTYKTAEGLVRAVCGVTFSVKPGEFYTLLGASGCGKTTVLRCIAGLESPDRGHIAIGDQVVFSSAERIAEPPLSPRHRHGVPILCHLAALERLRQRGLPSSLR